MDYNEYKNILMEMLEHEPSRDKIYKFVEEYKKSYPKYTLSISKATFSVLKDTDTVTALDIIEPELENIDDLKFLKIIQKRYKKIGNFEKTKIIQEKCKIINKKLLVKEAIETFNKNKKIHDIDFAIEELNSFLNHYYYLERTILKKIHADIRYDYPEIAKKIAKKLVDKFNDNAYEIMC